jgi:hypothetical protein
VALRLDFPQSLDHVIRPRQERGRDGEAQRLGGLQVDHESVGNTSPFTAAVALGVREEISLRDSPTSYWPGVALSADHSRSHASICAAQTACSSR